MFSSQSSRSPSPSLGSSFRCAHRPPRPALQPTARPPNSFSCNTYGFPRKCCKQKTYGRTKSFSCNTYKKHGGGGLIVNQKSDEGFLSRATIGRERRLFKAD